VTAIYATGSDEQKRTYLPKMISGEWLGTMNLTEPQCGTDLGLIKTKAEPQGDGSYAITGTKIFISAGEHDLTENIIHLVLAKTLGAPEGSKGISLFLVPKMLIEADGSLGARNAVSCGSIEHKMGIHGNATCVMNFDGATGWLVGGANEGLAAMFIMMNAARLGVGVQGLAQSEVAYQNAVQYAKERRQGRALVPSERPDPSQAADPIIVHPDVRRMLMDAKAFNEGMRALILWGALLADLEHAAQTDEERANAEGLLGLLTPVIKGYGTDRGYDMANAMMQVFGGHGYIAETGVEQFVRDSRIAMIYEGTNGIQAMDLVGRKLSANNGVAMAALIADIRATVRAARSANDPRLVSVADRLDAAAAELETATAWMLDAMKTNRTRGLSGATAYLRLAGDVAGGHYLAAGAVAETDGPARERAIALARFYAEDTLSQATGRAAAVSAVADALADGAAAILRD
jgi:alkylation response protein AidB-like acyl-CoA dehydrogenase